MLGQMQCSSWLVYTCWRPPATAPGVDGPGLCAVDVAVALRAMAALPAPQQRLGGKGESPVRLHPGTGASPTRQQPKALPRIDAVAPAIIHWDGPCKCVLGGEMCAQCKQQAHPFAAGARSIHWDGSPERFTSPSPVRALSASPHATLGDGPVFPMDGISALAPFRRAIEKLNGAVEQAEDKLQASLVNQVAEQTSLLMDHVTLPTLQPKERQALVERNGKVCLKLLQQRNAKSARVRQRAAAQVMKLLDQFATELASRANSEFEGKRTDELQKREKVAKQLRYKLEHSHYDVDSQVHQHVAVIQAEANSRVAERDAVVRQRDDTIARLERELAAMTTLNSKLVERENLAAERLAKDAVKRLADGDYNPELSPGCSKSTAAKEALLETSHSP